MAGALEVVVIEEVTMEEDMGMLGGAVAVICCPIVITETCLKF